MKTILICADDFGFNDGVSQGILNLVAQKRLSAVSCMVNLPAFSAYAQKLLMFKSNIQIGLHFNLTENHPYSLADLLLKSHLNVLPLALIAEEFNAQLSQFIEIMGFFPHFIDGHQHVHQLPGVRKVLLEKALQLQTQSSWVRATYPVKTFSLKAVILALTGGWHLQRQLKKKNIAFNPSFDGIYNFNPQQNYRTLFRRWLKHAQEGAVIMCHPGYADQEKDAIAATRPLELAYLLSPQFLDDCAEYHCKLYYS